LLTSIFHIEKNKLGKPMSLYTSGAKVFLSKNAIQMSQEDSTPLGEYAMQLTNRFRADYGLGEILWD
jgi:hypothetical protein